MAARINRILAVALVLVSVLFISNVTSPRKADLPARDLSSPGLGLLKHRGRMYRVEDLLNAKHAGASGDRFVERFSGGAPIATRTRTKTDALPWAGLNHDDFGDH